MAPARHKNAEGARKGPLMDASSKANSLPYPSPSKKASRLTASIQRSAVPSKNDAQPATTKKKAATVRSQLAPPVQSNRSSAASHVLREALNTRAVKTHIGPWQLGSTVGTGGTCTVRVVRHARTQEFAVAKIISKVMAEKVRARSLANLNHRLQTANDRYTADLTLPVGLEREIVIMKLLDHPNIVHLHDVWENSNEIYLIMEQVKGGELFKYIEDHGKMSEKEAVFLFRQLVEALLYCHRMQICHRDLKPENILIDRATMTIKVIDFGMAAYQPTGDLLKTPCGSPHYAAPELLEGKPYDGSKADVWSLTVVLFIMLTNGPPFNFRPEVPEEAKLRDLYEEIKACRVKVPSYLSKEAKDLFRKAFVRDPKNRIDIKSLWDHPLLHKYDKEFQYQSQEVETWIGEAPVVRNWTKLTPETIDTEIFRNLRTLWHDSDEATLVSQLCNSDFYSCPVKYFYYALSQYRDKQIDSMTHSPSRSAIPISDSDYHHAHGKQSTNKKAAHSRSNSQFSVFQGEHFKSKHSFFEEQISDASYDPFKITSRETVTSEKAKGQSHQSTPGTISKNSNQRHSLRVETLKRRRSGAAAGQDGTARNLSLDRLSISSKRSKTRSRTSNSSTHGLGNHSPIIITKPSERHKRHISFDHQHRHSTPISGLVVSSAALLDTSLPIDSSGLAIPEMPSSPPVASPEALYRPRKGAPTPRTRRLKDIEHAARKISTELEAACEKAFFRSSISEASFRSSSSEPAGLTTETPPSSVSNRSSIPPRDPRMDMLFLNRPLPPTPRNQNAYSSRVSPDPKETPCTYTTRELYETRERLADKYQKEGITRNRPFTDILRHLDSLMPEGPVVGQNGNGNTSSSDSSFLHSYEDLDFLQPIPEEGRFNDSDELLVIPETTSRHHKILARESPSSVGGVEKSRGTTTVRIVEPSLPGTPTPLAPLKIRKSIIGAYDDHSAVEFESFEQEQSTSLTTKLNEVHKQRKGQNGAGKPQTKNSWWRRATDNSDTAKARGSKQPVRTLSSGSDWEDLDDRVSRRNERAAGPRDKHASDAHKFGYEPIEIQDFANNDRYYRSKPESNQQTPIKTSNYLLVHSNAYTEDEGGLKRSGFFKGLFQKKSKTVYGVDRNISFNLNDGSGDVSMEHVAVASSAKKKDPTEWNLLDRLLWFKPESRVFIMSHPRKASRFILCRALTQERESGIKDLAFDSINRNTFTGRLDKENKWHLKPVSFALEFFSILRNGKQSSLTAVRFTQTRGCGASLRKLVELLCHHLEDGHLHTNAKEVKEMTKLIQTGRVEPE